MQGHRKTTLGVLQLDNKPMMVPGCVNTSETFGFPVLGRIVPGARVSNTVAGDPSLEPMWIDAARALQADGVAAITSNCGFALRYQAAIAAAVSVPVSTSSLMLLPYLLRSVPDGGKVGVLTYDGRHFDPNLLALAGVPKDAPIVVAGIEGTKCHELMLRPDNPVTVDELKTTVLDLAQAMAKKHRIGSFLFECAGFGPASPLVRQRIGRPVWDATDNARILMMGVIGQLSPLAQKLSA